MPAPQILSSNLQDPQGITLDSAGNIYISERGDSHQVKVFDTNGKMLRAIGKAGAPKAGPYDVNHMNNPKGLAIDANGRLWVAEEDYQPKRVSVWDTQSGAFWKAFYGPSQYGGGGTLDPRDKTRFYYTGMEFKLDWKSGENHPVNVFFRPDKNDLQLPDGYGAGGQPETPIYVNGRQYLTNCYNSNPTNGASIAGLWLLDKNGIARPVAAMGQANDWSIFRDLLPQRDNFSVRWSGVITPKFSEDYTFVVRSDDGARLWVNDENLINKWDTVGEFKGSLKLEAGKAYSIKLEYRQQGGGASTHLLWQSQSQPLEIVPTTVLRPDAASQTNGLSAEYFRDSNLSDLRFKRIEANIDNDWPTGAPPDPSKADLAARLPKSEGQAGQNPLFFLWQDLNGDAHIQAPEVTFRSIEGGSVDGVTVMADASFVVANLSGRAEHFKPQGFAASGVPRYTEKGEVLVQDANHPASSGGGQALVGTDGWAVFSNAPQPFSAMGLGGAQNGKASWSYPSLWPGLHASHEAPVPTFAGEIIGTTRLIGGMVTPKGEAGPLWGINGNMGNMYLLTQDGLFVAQLFQDVRQGKLWTMPIAERNMKVNDISLHDENFWPTITQTQDGTIYLNSSLPNIVRVDGLDTIKRIAPMTLRISPDDLKKAQEFQVQAEAERQKSQGKTTLEVALRADAPQVDGKLEDWQNADWASIDKRGVAANFNSDSKPYDVSGAVTIAGDKLFAAWRTGDRELLRNSGEVANAPFKTGGALDLMIGTNADADAKRGAPVEGDVRLLITRVKDKTFALLYRAVVPGSKESVPFSSPWRTITIDRVEDISAQVQMASDNEGNYEISVPLSALGLKPEAGQNIKGDIGILRGTGTQTTARVYWSNKATAITADVPSEAQLTPQLWGTWQFKTLP